MRHPCQPGRLATAAPSAQRDKWTFPSYHELRQELVCARSGPYCKRGSHFSVASLRWVPSWWALHFLLYTWPPSLTSQPHCPQDAVWACAVSLTSPSLDCLRPSHLPNGSSQSPGTSWSPFLSVLASDTVRYRSVAGVHLGLNAQLWPGT